MTAWVPAIVSAIIAVYIYGQLTNQVKWLVRGQLRHEERLDAHDERLVDHTLQLEQVRSRYPGFRVSPHVNDSRGSGA